MSADTLTTIIYLLIVLVIILFLARNAKRFIVYEYERGLLYRNGRFHKVLEPGQYWLLNFRDVLYKVDVRKRTVSIPGQEVVSSDNVSIKISLSATYKFADLNRAVHETANYQDSLYSLLQLQLRDLVSSTPINELLAKRKILGEQLLEGVKDQAEEIGLTLISVGIKDTMFPGELKNIFAQVVNAQNEGLAALERARGESAALRNLANAAKMLENNPHLFQLRLLQSLNSTSGNTILLKLADDGTAIDLSAQKRSVNKSAR